MTGRSRLVFNQGELRFRPRPEVEVAGKLPQLSGSGGLQLAESAGRGVEIKGGCGMPERERANVAGKQVGRVPDIYR